VAERRGPAGVKEQGTFIVGFSRNLGGPVASANASGVGESGKQSLARSCSVLQLRERSPRRVAVLRSEGNEATWEGRQEVGVLYSTGEAGEPRPEGPCGGKGASEHGYVRGKDGGDIELHNHINET
jgi:hypothetical protein